MAALVVPVDVTSDVAASSAALNNAVKLAIAYADYLGTEDARWTCENVGYAASVVIIALLSSRPGVPRGNLVCSAVVRELG